MFLHIIYNSCLWELYLPLHWRYIGVWLSHRWYTIKVYLYSKWCRLSIKLYIDLWYCHHRTENKIFVCQWWAIKTIVKFEWHCGLREVFWLISLIGALFCVGSNLLVPTSCVVLRSIRRVHFKRSKIKSPSIEHLMSIWC